MFLRVSSYRKLLTLALTLGSAVYTANAQAEVWADVRDNVITNNGVTDSDASANDCNECHSYLNTLEVDTVEPAPLSRHGAPISVLFDGATDIDAYNNVTTLSTYLGSSADDGTINLVNPGVPYGFLDVTIDRIYEWMVYFTTEGVMPYDPATDADMNNIIDTFVDGNDLPADRLTIIKNWAIQGAPYAAPTAITDNNPTLLTKLSAVVQGDFDTNVHSGTAVPGTYYFEYGTTVSYGSSTSVSNRSSTTALSNTTKSITGLKCGTLYHYRARATNGSATGGSAAAGVDRTFSTLACTDPVIAGVVIVTDATDQNTNEDTFKDFSLTVTDDDPGSLQWSKTNGSMVRSLYPVLA